MCLDAAERPSAIGGKTNRNQSELQAKKAKTIKIKTKHKGLEGNAVENAKHAQQD